MRRPCGRSKLVLVDGKRATIRVDVEVDGDYLEGRVSTPGASARHFSGWLGLVAALDALITGVRRRPIEAPGPVRPDMRRTPCKDESTEALDERRQGVQ